MHKKVVETVDSADYMDLRVPGSPPPLGMVISDNLQGHIETLADTADIPATARKEKAASTKEKGQRKRITQKRPREVVDGEAPLGDPVPDETSPAETATDQSAKGRKPKAKATKGTAKGVAKPKGKGKQDVDDEGPEIEPPFTLHNRFAPPANAQCYMMGTVWGAMQTKT